MKYLDDVLKRLRIQGYGDFYHRDKYFIVKAPFINNAEVLCGFVEKLLGINLDVRTASAPFVFEVASGETKKKQK